MKLRNALFASFGGALLACGQTARGGAEVSSAGQGGSGASSATTSETVSTSGSTVSVAAASGPVGTTSATFGTIGSTSGGSSSGGAGGTGMTASDASGGSGGEAGSAFCQELGCTLSGSQGFCGETEGNVWICESPNLDYQMLMDRGCIDLATQIPRFCCPEDAFVECL